MCYYGSLEPYTIKDLSLYHSELKGWLTKKNKVILPVERTRISYCPKFNNDSPRYKVAPETFYKNLDGYVGQCCLSNDILLYLIKRVNYIYSF